MAHPELLERLKAAYVRRRDPQALLFLDVPDWADPQTGQSLRIYYRPITLHEREPMLLALKQGMAFGIATAFIHRALDENGDRLFDIKDRTEIIHHVDSDVLCGVVKVINDTLEPAWAKPEEAALE